MTRSDSGQLLYVPGWAKVGILLLLIVGTVIGAVVAIAFIGTPGHSDWVIVGIGASQVAGTGLIVAIVVLFSESDANIKRLEDRTDQCLKLHIPKALSRITVPGTDADKLVVKRIGKKDIFGHLYYLDGENGFRFKIWVGINVYRVFVIYFVDANRKRNNYTDRLKEIFQYTFGGAEQIGFHPFYERTKAEGQDIVSIWMSATVKDTFLTSPTEKLFWAQDVAMMTQSFLRTALRHGDSVNIQTNIDPRPL